MDFIERYLAVEDRPCRLASGELSAQLRTLLAARIEAREAQLRRPLRTDEAVAELAGFARRLLAESRAVMRRLEDACLGPAAPPHLSEGGSRGPH